MTTPDQNSADKVSAFPKLVLSVEEAASALQIGRTKMYELIGSGEVESFQIGRSRRIRSEALTEYVESKRPQAGPEMSAA